MKVRDLMTVNVLRIAPEEPVAVAARTLAQYNIGALPVCSRDGAVFGMVTDRDLVTRCLATGRTPEVTRVQDIMSRHIVSVPPDMDCQAAAQLMGEKQVRRLPVVENGRLCGVVSLGDLAQNQQEGQALSAISGNLSTE